MNSAEIQYALDRRGTVRIESGSILETPIQLAHLQNRAIIDCPGDLTYAGPPGRWAFEWNWESSYVHRPCHLIFNNIQFDRDNVAHGGFLRIHPGDKSPTSLSMKQCEFDSIKDAYAIDANGIAPLDSISLYDIRTTGSGSVRFIGAESGACYWFEIENMRKVGGGRPGAVLMLKNMQNLDLVRLIDDGTPALVSGLENEYVDAIAASIVNCRGYNVVDNLWYEPWGDWDVYAPDCWGFTVRADETSGNHKQHYVELRNVSLNASGIGASTKLFHFMGGDTSSNASSLRVDMVNQFDLESGSTQFGGKVMAVARQPMDNQEFQSADIAEFTDYTSDSFRDYWQHYAYSLPYQVYANRVTYAGSANESARTNEPAQYDA